MLVSLWKRGRKKRERKAQNGPPGIISLQATLAWAKIKTVVRDLKGQAVEVRDAFTAFLLDLKHNQ